MGVRNQQREILRRLDSKTLDAKFLVEVEHGLNCSPFEAEAVLEVVKEVYFPFIDEHCAKAPPGKVTLVAVSVDEPAGKPIAECEKQSVCLTVHRGAEEGKSPEVIARETYHSLEAVDRYLGQFDRVRHCYRQGLSVSETAQILNCSPRLVEAYRQLDQELEGKNG